MKGPLSDKIRIQHILDAIAEVEQYIKGITEADFLQNSEKRFATIKQIEIIGEACNRISPEIKDTYPPHCMETNYRVQEHIHSRILQRQFPYRLGNSCK